jgi:hypothetical protein
MERVHNTMVVGVGNSALICQFHLNNCTNFSSHITIIDTDAFMCHQNQWPPSSWLFHGPECKVSESRQIAIKPILRRTLQRFPLWLQIDDCKMPITLATMSRRADERMCVASTCRMIDGDRVDGFVLRPIDLLLFLVGVWVCSPGSHLERVL